VLVLEEVRSSKELTGNCGSKIKKKPRNAQRFDQSQKAIKEEGLSYNIHCLKKKIGVVVRAVYELVEKKEPMGPNFNKAVEKTQFRPQGDSKKQQCN